MGLSDAVDTKDLLQMAIGGMAAYGVFLSPTWVPTITQNITILIMLALVVFFMQYRRHRAIPGAGMLGKTRPAQHLWMALGVAFMMAFLIGTYLDQPMSKIMTATIVAFPGTVMVDALAGE